MGTKPYPIAAAAVFFVLALPISSAAQAAAIAGPRKAGGEPDLNGIWQTLNEANYDIEAQVARPAMALRPGPYGPGPTARCRLLRC